MPPNYYFSKFTFFSNIYTVGVLLRNYSQDQKDFSAGRISKAVDAGTVYSTPMSPMPSARFLVQIIVHTKLGLPLIYVVSFDRR